MINHFLISKQASLNIASFNNLVDSTSTRSVEFTRRVSNRTPTHYTYEFIIYLFRTVTNNVRNIIDSSALILCKQFPNLYYKSLFKNNFTVLLKNKIIINNLNNYINFMYNSMMTRCHPRKNIPRFSLSYSKKINKNKNNFIHYLRNIFLLHSFEHIFTILLLLELKLL